MKIITKRLIAILLMLTMVILTFSSTGYTAYAATNTTYTFNQMTYYSSYGLNYSVNTSGALTVNFEGQYKEIKYTLPSTINMTDCNSITINAVSEFGNTAIKFYDASGNEVFVKYNCYGSGTQNYTITPNSSQTIYSIGIMSQDTASYSATVHYITFTMKSGSSDANATLKSSYSGIFGKIGSAVTLSQLQDSTTLNFIKKHYNSITMENEMKPDALLGYSPTLITVSEARQKGYIIPSGYTETHVPVINYSNVDNALSIAAANGLGVRFHTLIWHNQTPAWFFKSSYNSNNGYVSSGTMDARVEFYVKNVVAHIHSGDYSSTVYAWDVVNEYFHNMDNGTCHWTEIYGEQGSYPTYVKDAFRHTSELLSYYNLRDSVKLFYNDYNTYLISDNIVSLLSYINSEIKYCDGVGMQTHLDVDWPSISFVGLAVQKFIDVGLEVQLTEIDATINYRKSGYTLNDQANYYYELMSMLVSKKKAGGNITGITFWGLYDSVSWRASGQPLLFTEIDQPKSAYYSVIDAASSY